MIRFFQNVKTKNCNLRVCHTAVPIHFIIRYLGIIFSYSKFLTLFYQLKYVISNFKHVLVLYRNCPSNVDDNHYFYAYVKRKITVFMYNVHTRCIHVLKVDILKV